MNMRTAAVNSLELLLGRRRAWRLGRSLYLKARADGPNAPRWNGEESLQRQLLAAFAAGKETLTVFDVGANVGEWTGFLLREASRLEMDGRFEIHSFEPSPSTFAVLRERIGRHPLGTSVRLVSQAASREDGIADMYVSGETAGTNALYPDAMKPGQRSIRVETTTLDSYCSRNGLGMIHFVKCDTEGHEIEVIAGAKKLFDAQKVLAFQFEYNHRWVDSRHYLKDAFDLFQGTVYRVGKVTPGGIELYPEWHPELERFFEANYILLHPEALRWFKTMTGAFDRHNVYRVQPARPAADASLSEPPKK